MAVSPPDFSDQVKRLQAQVRTLTNDDAVAEQEHRLDRHERFIHFWLLVGQNFIRNRCPVRASALAYTTLLALVPLLAVSISVATLFLPRDEIEQKRALQRLIDSAVIRVAPALGLADSADAGSSSSPRFSADDYNQMKGLVDRMVKKADPVSSYLWAQLPPETQETLKSWDGGDARRHEVELALSKSLNELLQDKGFYEKARFATVTLSDQTRELLAVPNPNSPGLQRRNRLLLQDVYPQEIVPMTDSEVTSKIVQFVGNIRFGTIGASAMAGLLFVAISLLRTVEAAFNDIWGVPRGRSWFMSVVLYWTVISLGPVLVVVAKSANYLQFLDTGMAPAHGVGGFILGTISWLFSLGVMSLAFAALYLWMPNTRVGWQAALVGGLVAASLWTLNGRLSAFYNTKVVTYNAIYGSLGVVPLFLLGMYLSWLILLFGAQTAYVFQFRNAYLQERQAGRVHHQAREFIALRLMTLVGERFLNAERPMNATQMAERLSIPPKLAKDTLQTLVNTGLLTEVAGTEVGYVPGRPLGNITVHDILRAIRAGLGQEIQTAPDEARAIVRTEFEAILAAGNQRAGATTLENLVQRTQGALALN
jgi:membrane protein